MEATTKSKLRTFIHIYNYDHPGTLINANLSRLQRSLVTKFKVGVLPIRLETGRYKGLGEEKRTCELCLSGEIENELHFIFKCTSLEASRNKIISLLHKRIKGVSEMKDIEILKVMLQEEHVKEFASGLVTMYEHRKELLYT